MQPLKIGILIWQCSGSKFSVLSNIEIQSISNGNREMLNVLTWIFCWRKLSLKYLGLVLIIISFGMWYLVYIHRLQKGYSIFNWNHHCGRVLFRKCLHFRTKQVKWMCIIYCAILSLCVKCKPGGVTVRPQFFFFFGGEFILKWVI